MTETRAPRLGEVIETSLYVDDLDRSFAFYEQVIGLERASEPQERIRALKVTVDQVLLLFQKGGSVEPTVTEFGTIPPNDGDGSLHVAFAVPPEDFEAWLAYLPARGVEIESTVDWPTGGRSLYFRDPDHHLIELKTSNWFGKELSW